MDHLAMRYEIAVLALFSYLGLIATTAACSVAPHDERAEETTFFG